MVTKTFTYGLLLIEKLSLPDLATSLNTTEIAYRVSTIITPIREKCNIASVLRKTKYGIMTGMYRIMSHNMNLMGTRSRAEL